MSETPPQLSEQTSTPIPTQPVQSQAVVQARHGFSGRQVVGIVLGVVVLLAAGLAVGGVVGYRMGAAEGAQQALVNVPQQRAQRTPQTPVPDQRTPGTFGLPLPQMPFGGQAPAANPGGPYLGVQYEMITPELAVQEGITGTTGALIRDVIADSPAAQAGLKVGDVIIAVNGQSVDNQNDLRSRVAGLKPNDEITLTLVKGTANGPTDQHDVKVTLGEQPAPQSGSIEPPDMFGLPVPFGKSGPNQAQPAPNGPYLGVEYEMLTPEIAAQQGITGTSGALIKAVMSNSPAVKAGLKVGDVITAVDGQTITADNNLQAIVLNHKPGDEINLTVVKGTANGPTDQHEVMVTLAESPAGWNFQMPPGFQPSAPSPDSREG